MNLSNKKADWLAFILHFVFGLVVGAVVGLITISRRRQGFWLHEDLILSYLVGTALIGGGLGAKFGDRLWTGGNYLVIPPDAPTHSRLSRFVAFLAILGGIILAGGSVVRHFT